MCAFRQKIYANPYGRRLCALRIFRAVHVYKTSVVTLRLEYFDASRILRHSGSLAAVFTFVNPQVDCAVGMHEEAADDGEYGGEPGVEVPVRLVFKGNASDYFRLWIVNLCLTLFTFGIFSAWAKVRRKRYFYSHTELAGVPFEYLGEPLPILRGRVIAAVLVAVWWLSNHVFTPKIVFGLLVVFLLFLPWVLVRTAAFNARYSAYRNMTFHFNGSHRGGFGAMLTGVVLAAVTCGLAYPWAYVHVRRYFIERTSFGGVPASYHVRGGQLAVPFLLGFATLLALYATLFAVARASGDFQTSVSHGILWSYAPYMLVYGYVVARLTRINWRYTWLGPIGFRPAYRARDFIWLYVSNVAAIVVSLGLLIPWASVRMHRYRIQNLRVVRHGPLDLFEGTEQHAVRATGAEVADLFDFDLSL